MHTPNALLAIALATSSLACESTFQNVVVVDVHPTTAPDGDADPRALTEFDDALAGYGVWSEDPAYGAIWTPSDATFVPYATSGRFADLGEVVWLSELPWGAATLHHGRWVRHEGRWRWVPGMKYAGAWVTWSHDGETTSWSPAPPTLVFRSGVAVRITPPPEPIVGARNDLTLALVPPKPEVLVDDALELHGSDYRTLSRMIADWSEDAVGAW
jgi:hypothetical protein